MPDKPIELREPYLSPQMMAALNLSRDWWKPLVGEWKRIEQPDGRVVWQQL